MSEWMISLEMDVAFVTGIKDSRRRNIPENK